VDYIEKPFSGQEVKARVETHLKLQYYQKQLEEQAASSEKRFQLTFENAAVGIAHTRLNGSFFRVNKYFCSILGYDEPDFENLTVKDLTLPEEWDQYLLAIKDLFGNRISTIRREKQFIRKDKQKIWGRVTVSMARDSQNDSEYGIMVVEEITDRIEAENNRKKMEGQLRQAQRMEAIGTLTLTLKMVSPGSDLQTNPLPLIPGNYNLFEFLDTGSGIKPALLEHIFEPYFTTKPKDRGTDLGLSVVHGIIKSHEGEIFVTSQRGRGTCFKIYLPCLEEKKTSHTLEKDGAIPCGTAIRP
jgi:PAS domain S-box-containing protein